jgi:hypothetical protein
MAFERLTRPPANIDPREGALRQTPELDFEKLQSKRALALSFSPTVCAAAD